VALVGAGVLLAVLLVTWAASIGPGEVLRGDGPSPATPTAVLSSDSSTPSEDDPSAADPVSHRNTATAVVQVLAVVLNIAALGLALVLLARLLRWVARVRRLRRVRRSQVAALDGPAFQVLPPSAAVARELLADAEGQRDALTDGAPRNAIVSCWQRFEAAAAAAGVERKEWETSSEHIIRILELVTADSTAVSRLARLYREARFSEHELTETDRAAALQALDAIHHTIGAPA
jgi:hypothetical protein